MVEFEKKRSAQDKESAQEKVKVQKQGQKSKERTICSQAIYLEKSTMCNQTPSTPAHSISPSEHPISSPSSSMSSNSWAIYYTTSTALYGQRQCATTQAEVNKEEIMPADSVSAWVSPTHRIISSLDILALIHNRAIAKEDVVMDHNEPQGFKNALQSFQAVQAKLDNILGDNSNGKLNISHQLEQKMAEPPATVKEVALEEVFMEQGVANTSATIKQEAGFGPLPLEDAESSIMSSLDS